jgi:WD40 repeat protein
VATGATNGTVKVWDLSTGAPRASLAAEGGVIKVAWAPGHPSLLAASTAEGFVHLWDARDGSLVRSLTGHTGMILDLAFTLEAGEGKGATVVTCGDDSVARVYTGIGV